MVWIVTNSFEHVLQDSFPILFLLEKYSAKLSEQIVKPAVGMAMLFQTLLVRYKFTPKLDFPPLQLEQISFSTLLEQATVRDIKTRKKLKLHSNVILDENGCAGDQIMATEPGLVRCGTNMQTEISLRKPQVVVYLTEPLSKRHR